MCRIADLQAMIQQDLCRLAEKYEEIQRIIDKVEDDTCRNILSLRYLSFLTWEEIAEKMNYSYKWVHVLHGKA